MFSWSLTLYQKGGQCSSCFELPINQGFKIKKECRIDTTKTTKEGFKMKTIFDLIKKPYYYVSTCPYCGSPVTGRYVRVLLHYDWVRIESLRHGEHVRYAYDNSLRNMAFCLECGYHWPEEVTWRWMSLREIKHQKEIRHTNDCLESVMASKKKTRRKSWFDIF